MSSILSPPPTSPSKIIIIIIIIEVIFKQRLASTEWVFFSVYLEEECVGTIAMDEGRIPAGRLAVTRRSKYLQLSRDYTGSRTAAFGDRI